jgi:hypothetical protein
MAALNLQVSPGEISVTSTAKTFLTLKAASNQRVKLKGFEITENLYDCIRHNSAARQALSDRRLAPWALLPWRPVSPRV